MAKLLYRGVFAVGLVACGGDTAALVLDDAGQAMRDAAEWLDDGGQADAQEKPVPPDVPPGIQTIEAECSLSRTVLGTPDSEADRVEHWAKVEVGTAPVLSWWTCGVLRDPCAAHGCEGDEIPVPECWQGVAFQAKGAVYVSCVEGQTVRVVLGPEPDR